MYRCRFRPYGGKEAKDRVEHGSWVLHEQSVTEKREFHVLGSGQKFFGKGDIGIAEQSVKFGIALQQKHRAGNLRQHAFGVPSRVTAAVEGHAEGFFLGQFLGAQFVVERA